MNDKNLRIKLMAIQGIMSVFRHSEVPLPNNFTEIEGMELFTLTQETFNNEIVNDTELETLEAMLRELLDEVLYEED